MKIKILSCIPALVCFLAASANLALAQSTVFTYQGRLNSGTSPANGIYDLTFSLFNAGSGAGQVGSTYPTPNTAVSNGLFTVSLDFGANFPGANRWLEIAVRTNGAVTFTTLAPRQALTATPYAIQAANAALAAGVSPSAVTGAGIQDATITSAKVASGQVVKSLNGLFDAVTLSAGANVTLTTNGNSLQLSSSGGVTSGWGLGGNGGTTSANFLGSTDNQPLELRANGNRALRLEPNPSGAPNVIAGSSVNFVAAGVKGAVIGGGGATNYSGVPYTNSVAADFSTVSGGFANSIQASASSSSIGGGYFNTIQLNAILSTIGGGYLNIIGASANQSSIGGGYGNTIQPSAGSSVIGGGYVNTIGTNSINSTISGGGDNTVQINSASSTIAGGVNNIVQPNATFSTIGGGLSNTNLANAAYATIPGGALNAVGGSYGFAAGHRAKALHPGAFVWADSTDADFPSVTTNEFAIRAAGGVRISDTSPGLFFGTTTRQMLNLFQTGYGIGVQDYTVYQRSGGGFAWYLGGTHTNAQNNPGGGSTLMTLDSSGNLTIAGAGSFNGGAVADAVFATALVNGVHGFSAAGNGIYGETISGTGVTGHSSGSGTAVWGASSGAGDGIYGTSGSGVGVRGHQGSGTAAGYFEGDVGITGDLTVGTSAFTAIVGTSSGSGHDGVYGSNSHGNGVHGASGSASDSGVWANNTGGGYGVTGTSDAVNGIGVYGRGAQWAGYFAGPVSVCSLQIRGGCDVAEPFQMSHQEIPKGSVVVIDNENAGQLKLSDRAYDSRVAGIVSGANGVNPGISLSQEGVLEGGQDVALSGRVYVLADASNGPINPGDLLTTSSTPGHAMRVADHSRAQGAILGKAMSSLKDDKGMVLVLVTLQ